MINLDEVRSRALPSPDRGTDAPAPGSPTADPVRASWLLCLLVAIDLAGALAVWEPVIAGGRGGPWLARLAPAAPLAITISLVVSLVNRAQRLYLARVCTVRSAEMSGLTRTSVVAGAAAVWLSGPLHQSVDVVAAVIGGAATLAVLIALRTGYARWLRSARANGRFTRAVCVLGTSDEAHDLVQLFAEQPELGYRVVGVIGDQHEWASRASDVPVI